ncbi:single-stranded-DNA-specific exonuclease RecJ [endosymbiont of Pachyrhynchus infernalis]|uniref:single-stranded-DNA-specific exonuclease RecJ n=1 Tax=endosymbiont of Pachyrhynchus infernalis TaxID=1971488 RepID=UPI000DC6F0FD|nr:single-stranded-DNA-specific exonuclease RecJ [endosymbiont of Pachyrhynchus infernalis]BBA84756.1 single-stranded DNA-specific exonuclease [endosymbiont of Pachyrhynchus infernalis]
MKDFIKLNRRSKEINNNLNNFNIPEIIKKIYSNRGITSINDINLNIDNIFNYKLFKNINKAINILINFLFNNEKIVIVGDFDTDGVTSTALCFIALKKMGFNNVDFIIPNRFKDGHGLSINIIEKIISINGKLILTVDNGISSFDEINLAKKNNILTIITDHHIPKKILPKANVIINPNLNDCKFPSKYISGVGISYYLMKALNNKLINLNWFKNNSISIPNINNLLDLVAIGTIADMSYLDTNNRILIKEGINIIKSKNCRLGIITLIEYLNIDIENLSTLDINFYIVPRINSAGRLKDMSISIKLLLTEDKHEALYISKELNILNSIRKKISKDMELKCLNILDNLYESDKKYSLIIYNLDFHNGILGIVSSRLKDKFNKPTIVFSKLNNDILIGSGRSIENINIYEIINSINNLYPDLILKFGGHNFAIGLSLNIKNFEYFKNIFNIQISNYINKNNLDNNNYKIIWSDGELLDSEFTLSNVKHINNNGPWGNGFPYPIFDGKFYLIHKEFFNKNILKIIVKTFNGLIINGILFNVDIDFWNNLKSNKLVLAYKLYYSKYFNDNKIQILVEYAYELF